MTDAEWAAKDLRVCPPRHLSAFRAVVRQILADGRKPTPKAIGEAMPSLTTKQKYDRGYTLPSGKYGAARRQELRTAGYRHDDRTSRWLAP